MVDFEGNKHGGFDVENGGEKEFDMNSNSLQAAPASASPGSRILAADANGVVVLPAGVSPEDIDTQGRDIVITLADGSTIIIPDGAIIVPQLVIDGVAIPPQTVAALLNGAEEINPEDQPGQLPSSGGEFDDGTSSLQDAFGLGDLLPYTELSREVVVEEEIIPFENEEPDVVIETEDNPIGVENAIATVDEDGLPIRGGEPEGTRDETDSEITSGTIVFEAPDGLSAIILNGVEITSVGQTFTTIYGTLEIASIDLDSGEIGFIYTLEDNLLGETVDGNFTVTVVDRDGDTATANLSIIVIDDEPIAVLDTNTVAGGTYGPIHGNVLDNDESGADDYPEGEETVEAVISFTNGTDTAGPGETLTGQWGELTLNADGTYTYTRFYNTPGDETDTFNYTIIDQDGSTASADLVITIEDAPNDITFVPREGDGTVVDESGLPEREGEPEGTEEPTDGEFTSGLIEFTSPDGVSAVIIAGQTIVTDNLPQTVVDDETGMLVITGYTYDPVTGKGTISYEYTLGDNTDEAEKSSVEFSLEIIDLDGDSTADNGPDSLVINIIDDVPEAKDDTDSVKEDGPVVADGNVISGVGGSDDNATDGVADIEGADGASLVSVTYDGNAVTIGEAFVADYGTITINADGSYTYTLDNANPLIQGLSEGEAIGPEVFEYTIEDGDGDPSVATLTINITGTDDEVTITGLTVEGPDVTVDEDDLPDGTDQTKESTTQPDGDATFDFTSVDSLATVKIGSMTFTAQDLIDNEGTGLAIDIAGAYGTLTIRGISVETAPDGSVISGTFTYDYTLNTNTLDHVDPTPSAADEDSVFDDFAVVVTDVDGSVANATLTAEVIDDVPLTDENDAITLDDDDLSGGNLGGDGDEDSSVSTSGTLAHDFGADGGTIDFAVMDGEEAVIGGVTVAFTWDAGTSTLTANDGTNDVFEVVLNTATGGFTVNQLNPLDHHLVGDDYEGTPEFDLTYTVTDGDDDTATGTLTVRVNDDTPEFGELIDDEQEPVELPKLYTDDSNVDPDTNATDSDNAFFSGLFNPLFGADGPAATDPIVYSFGLADPIDDKVDSGLNDSITDENILLRVSDSDSNVIEGYLETSGDIAFTLTLDPETSEITQEQFRAIEHDNPNDAVESGDEAESMDAGLIKLTATITDGDGDQAENTVDIGDAFNFEDDGPAFGAHLVGVGKDEDNIDGGNGDSAPGDSGHSVGPTYTFNIDFGADGAGADELTVSLSSVFTSDPAVGAIALTSGGDAVLFDWNAATNTWTGYTTDINDPVMTLVFDVDAGTVAVNVMQPLDHPSTDADGANNGPEIGYEDNLSLTFSITATDGDGDWVTTNLVVVIDDDMAVATDNALTVGEGESDGGDVILDDDGDDVDAAGADGYAVDGPVVDADFVSGEQGITEISKDVAPDGTITIVTSAGTLVLNTDGTYTFDADTNSVNADADIVFSYTIEDGDGDQSAANLTITIDNVGGTAEADDLTVDEKGLPNGTDEAADNIPENVQTEIDSGSIVVTGGSGTLTYTLVGGVFDNNEGNGGALDDPTDDTYTITTAYGTIVLNAYTGAYTYTLNQEYGHDAPPAPNIADFVESFDYVVVDELDNVIVDSRDLGGDPIRVSIIDDVPSIDVTKGADAGVVLATQDAETDGNPTDEDTAVSTAAFGGVFGLTSTSGADGAAAPSLSYALSLDVGEGDPSNLTIGGVAIKLYINDSGVVTGSTAADEGSVGASNTVFTLSVDSDGVVTLTQYQQVDHPISDDPSPTEAPFADDQIFLADDLVSLTASSTITDGDGDTATDSETVDLGGNVRFDDDGPTIDVTKGADAGVVLATQDAETDGNPTDEDTAVSTAAFGGVFGLTSTSGADGAAAPSLSYALSLDVGEGDPSNLTIGGVAIKLYINDSGVVTGSTAADEGSVGASNTVFTLSVDSDGVVTLTQYQQVDHPISDDPSPTEAPFADDQIFLADDLVSLTASSTITDGDGDTATDSETVDLGGNVRFDDDGPTLDSVQDGTANNDPAAAHSFGSLNFLSGADGAGDVADIGISVDLTGITSGGAAINQVTVDGVLYAYTGTPTFTDGVPDSGIVFNLAVDPITDEWEFDLQAPLDGEITPIEVGSGSSFGVGPSGSVVVTDDLTSLDLVYVTGWKPTGGFTGTEESDWLDGDMPTMTQFFNVNGSTQGWGLANNNFDVTEFLRFDFGTLNDYDDPTEYGDVGADGSYEPPIGQTIVGAEFATFSFFQFGNGDVIEFVAHYTDGTTETFVFDDPADPRLTAVGNDLVFTITSPLGAQIDWVDTYMSAGSIKLNLIEIGVRSEDVDADLNFTVTMPDGDDDTDSDSFTINVADDNSPSVVTPIVLDLDGGGNEFVSASSNLAAYDYDGDGVKTQTAWVAAGSAILFHDTNGDGVVTDASEFVFGHDGMTDMEAVLKLYDSNNNGQLDEGDAEYGKFGVWMDDGDAQAEDGEFASLSDMHITSIDLVSDGIQTVEGDGDVTVYGTSTFSIDGVVAGEASDAAFALGSDVDGAMMEALLAMSAEEGSDGDDTRTTDEVDVIVKDVLAEDAVDAMLNEITGHDDVQTADAGAFDAATLTHVIDGGAFVYDNNQMAVMDDHAAAELAAVHA